MKKLIVVLSSLSVKLKAFISSNNLDIIELDKFINLDNILENYDSVVYIQDINISSQLNYDNLIKIKDKCLKFNKHLVLCLNPKLIKNKTKEIQNYKIPVTLIYKPFLWDYFYEKNIIYLDKSLLKVPVNLSSVSFIGLSEMNFLEVLSKILLNPEYHKKTLKIGELFILGHLGKITPISKSANTTNLLLSDYDIIPDSQDLFKQTCQIHSNCKPMMKWYRDNYYNFKSV